jgi:ribosomal protein L32
MLISFKKRLTKKFAPLPNNLITKYGRPKNNITECLDCGSFHENGTICTKCYEVGKKM